MTPKEFGAQAAGRCDEARMHELFTRLARVIEGEEQADVFMALSFLIARYAAIIPALFRETAIDAIADFSLYYAANECSSSKTVN